MAQQTNITGNRFAHQYLSIEIDGYELPKGCVQALNYKWTQEPGKVQGNQVPLAGRTPGYGEGSGDMSLLRSEADALNLQLTNGGQASLTEGDHVIVATWAVNDIDRCTDRLRGTRLTEIATGSSNGTQANVVNYTLSFTRGRLNGIEMGADPSV